MPTKAWLARLITDSSNIKHVELEDACSLAYVEAIGRRSQHPGVKQVKTLTFDLKSQQTLSILSAASEHADGVTGDYMSRPKDLLHACTATTDLTLRYREAVAHPKDDNGQAEDLRQILRAAKDVRTLHLEYGNFFNDQLYRWRQSAIEPQLALTPVLSSLCVPYDHLRELLLSAVVPGHALAEFLRLYSPTLKRLELRRSSCDDWETVLYTTARHLNLDRLSLFWLADGYHNCFDGQSWTLEKFEEDTWHFHHEQRYYWDGTPEDSELLRQLGCIEFREAMTEFFLGKGSLRLPPEFHTEWEDTRRWKGPTTDRQLRHAAVQGDD